MGFTEQELPNTEGFISHGCTNTTVFKTPVWATVRDPFSAHFQLVYKVGRNMYDFIILYQTLLQLTAWVTETGMSYTSATVNMGHQFQRYCLNSS